MNTGATKPATRDIDFEALVDLAFPRARARWSSFLLLSRPILDDEAQAAARVDLKARTLTLGPAVILERGLEGDIEALLAHEIGHLVSAPGSFVAEARLRLLERTFMPASRASLTVPFYELMVDERLGPSLAGARRRVFQAKDAGSDGFNPADLLQRAALEELWQLPEGELVGENEPDFADMFPDYRVDAQLLAQNLFALAPGLPLQFLYFASIAWRYAARAEPEESEAGEGEGQGDCMEGDASAEDVAEVLELSAAEKAAIKRALAEKWFEGEEAKNLKDQRLEKRIAAIPGASTGGSTRVTAVMAAHYRREAERWLFDPPKTTIRAEELVPTTLEEWDPGDPIASIDWVSTLLQRGEALGAAMPLVRERLADEEGMSAPAWEGRVEVYLDVSGSMPDPKTALNAMTLAAQILALGAVRAGGAARALVYSTGHEKWWSWSRSEAVLSRFLLHYIGRGTEFPFDVLKESVEELCAEQPVRIIITDRDFDMNYQASPGNAAIFAEAASRSRALVLLLHAPDTERAAVYEGAGARVVAVRSLKDFPRLSAELSFALFEQGRLAGRAGGQ